jgi:hypothetical protein
MIDAMWDALKEIEDQVRLEILEAEDGSEEERRARSLEDKLDVLGQVLGRVEDVLSEPKEPIVEPEPRRVIMWLGDLDALSEEAKHSGPGGTADHNLLVTLGEVIEHLNQWRK